MRRRIALWGMLLVVVALGVGGRYAWRRLRASAPPTYDLSAYEPEVARAVEEGIATVRRAPWDAGTWADLGRLLRAASAHERAAECFAQAAALAPDDFRWPYLRGEALLMHGDAESALPALRRAVALSDAATEPAPRLRLAEALVARGAGDEAREHLDRLRQVDPDNPNVAFTLALAALSTDDFATAKTLLERCRHSPMTQQRAHAQLAAVLARLGETTAAETAARKAKALSPDPAWSDPHVLECLRRGVGVRSRLRLVEQLEAVGRIDEAIERLRELVAEHPEARLWSGLGRDLLRINDFDEAINALNEAVRLEPDNVQAYYLLGRAHWSVGERLADREGEAERARGAFERAAASARRAVAGKADHALAHMILGLSLKRLGQGDEALTELRQAAELAPELCDPHLHLGEALTAAGRKDEARTHLHYAAEMARSDDPRPRQALERLGKGK